MAYARQREIRAELNDRFPKQKGNLGQQMFRSAYFNSRMAGADEAAAYRQSATAVRRHVPSFVPGRR